ncbi:Dyp-type peroxidase [Reichenbachiella versicolor]|uniref:Dyp-type peroxidase n=1 Tax=Reichenbachiella versicolor TaxID=1821036 RepID=UPI000D6DD22B|nr:Dyp-type peroxidase [Reichenbachiella versicolor]
MIQLEINDIQGIIRRGYGTLEAACYVLLKIDNSSKTKKWLANLANRINNGENKPSSTDKCINVAFTQLGLNRLGIEKAYDREKKFSIEFEDGMVTDHRKNILGDLNTSDPKHWEWGGPTNDSIHVLLLLYAGNQTLLEELYSDEAGQFASGGVSQIKRLETHFLPDRKEHFGFRDGIGQPRVAGLLDKHKTDLGKNISTSVLQEGGSYNNIIAAGEFVLGYPNAYQKFPNSPKVKKETDTDDILDIDETGAKDFGKNGSYLVFRQLEQHVGKFWNYVYDHSKLESGEIDKSVSEKLAAKMIGRWRSGCPITLSPDQDDPTLKDKDNFGYYPDDKEGDKCPMASHVRRTNPRNSPLQRKHFNDKEAKNAMVDANKHRIIRRGRAYGEPSLDNNGNPTMEPDLMLKDGNTGNRKVGLHFLCFNANIGRQFEFIQHTWVNNPKFSELYSEADPLLGEVSDAEKNNGVFGDFTAPGDLLRTRVRRLEKFVDVKGGAYFFMPGIKAIKYLSKLHL